MFRPVTVCQPGTNMKCIFPRGKLMELDDITVFGQEPVVVLAFYLVGVFNIICQTIIINCK